MTENPVEKVRPSAIYNGGFKLILDFRVRQPPVAKEPLCGNQPTNLSLVIAVFYFPSFFIVLLYRFGLIKEVSIENKYLTFC
jgi:hypothetical protein